MIDNIKPVQELRTLARSNARDFLTKSVHHKLLGDEIAKGWNIIKKRKTSVSLKKPKSHSSLLEDRVWMLLYRMQFPLMSAVGGGKSGWIRKIKMLRRVNLMLLELMTRLR